MSENFDFSLLELAAIYTALDNYIYKLEKLSITNNDIKLKGELMSAKGAQKKIRNIYVSKNGPLDYL